MRKSKAKLLHETQVQWLVKNNLPHDITQSKECIKMNHTYDKSTKAITMETLKNEVINFFAIVYKRLTNRFIVKDINSIFWCSVSDLQ